MPGYNRLRKLLESAMSQLILRAMVVAGVFLGATATGFAAPVPLPLAIRAVTQGANVQPVYYVWNHHRYAHRNWDKVHKRWRYY